MESVKKCSLCSEIKPLDDFSKDKSKSFGRCSSCKACHALYYRKNSNKIKKRVSNHMKSYADGTYCVYYLPEEHYVGMTNNAKNRMRQHRYKGKITHGHEIVARFDNPYDALILEAELHRRGYRGCQYQEDGMR